MWLLLEFGLSRQNEWLQRLALCGAWLGIWLALPGTDGSAGYREVRQLLVGTLGSPAFLTAFAVMLMALLAMACGVRRSELALVASALAGVVIGPQTLSLTTLASPRAMPLLLLAIALTWTALVRRHLAWCLLAAVGYVLSLTAALRGTWFAAGHGAVPLHLTLGAVLALGAVGAGRFASFLRGVGAVALGALPAVVLFGHTRIDPAAPELLAWAYAAVMGAVALALWLLQRDRRYLWAALVVALAAGLRGTATMARSLGEVQFRGGVPLAHGLFYFVVALVISLAKGGVLQRLADRLTAGRQTAHGGSRQES
jgi:hypothetical protein